MSWRQLRVEHFLQAANRLAPTILAERDAIEQHRGLPPDLFRTMRDAGFFSLWLPDRLGGPELSAADLVRVVEALARADGSVGWCAAIATSYSRLAGYLAEPVARDIFRDGTAVLAGTAVPTGRAEVVPGGYRVTGRWSFGSGIGHSDWLLGVCQVPAGDAPPDLRLMIFPKGEAEVLDTWHVSGLRGTGSHDFRVENLFVPGTHTLAWVPSAPTQPGRLYSLPFITVFSTSIAGVPLGIARAAIDAFMDLAESKTSAGSTQVLRDKAAVQAEIGRAEVVLRSARAFLFEAVDALWDAGEGVSLRDRALVRLALANVGTAATQVADMMFRAGGSASLYEGCRLARCWRDAHAATQHFSLSAASYETGGRVMLGMDPGTTRF
jgi:alkylation response protein AidB-like acyl-CoA dehydrogenase